MKGAFFHDLACSDAVGDRADSKAACEWVINFGYGEDNWAKYGTDDTCPHDEGDCNGGVPTDDVGRFYCDWGCDCLNRRGSLDTFRKAQ